MRAFIFPGQGSQFPGMGYDLFKSSKESKNLFHHANKILNFDIAKIMFEGSKEDLTKTNVTQPAIFIHSIALSKCTNLSPDMVAGHSLGEFSALVASKTLSFEDGLKLVSKRAEAMQTACDDIDSTMAAIIGLDCKVIEKVCNEHNDIVVPANYNSSNQIVISGKRTGVIEICKKLSNLGAKKTVLLPVSGAFHSPIMDLAKASLKQTITEIHFNKPICPIYQNVCAEGIQDPEKIKYNLIEQLTKPVKWFQTIEKMVNDGATQFFEIGPGNVLTGLNRRINRSIESTKLIIE
jgi:[acyl-carrier-protein] S-malonyltransferase